MLKSPKKLDLRDKSQLQKSNKFELVDILKNTDFYRKKIDKTKQMLNNNSPNRMIKKIMYINLRIYIH